MLLVGNARFVVYDVQTAMNDNDSDPEQENATHNIAEGGKATTGAGKQKTEEGHSQNVGNEAKHEHHVPKWLSCRFSGHRPLEWLTFAFEVLTFFALCVYSYFSYGQWQAMREQKDVMQGQLEQIKGNSVQTDRLIVETQNLAKAAGDANKLTEESLRARIVVKDARLYRAVAVNQRTTVVVDFENIGHATAIAHDRSATQRWRGMPDGDMPTKESGANNNSIEPGGKMTIYLVDKPATMDFLKALPVRIADVPQTLTPYFFGRIDYTTLSKPHHTDFCACLMQVGTDLQAIVTVPGREPRYMLFRCPKWVSAD